MGATLKTVAEAAGVSVSTVSNAYNKPEQLSADLRDRILKISRELGYAGPNAAARSLRSARAAAIGLLFTEKLSYAFSDPYSVGMLAGLSEIVERTRTGLLLIPLPERALGDTDPQALVDSAETARKAVVDGIVAYCVEEDHPALDVLMQRGLPLVKGWDADDSPCVFIDETCAARLVGEHISRLGHQNVAVVVDSTPDGPARAVADTDPGRTARLRLKGYRQGLGPDVRVTVVAGGHNAVESGRRAAEFVLDQRDRPTAILTTGDVLAFGVLAALRQRGLTPGRDISVAGFDDLPAAEAAGLTTVHQPIAEKGRLLGRMLLDPDFSETRVVLPTELVVRSTTGPVPARN
jgi:DNA-binding LacI/PurR family transcriptional regulator